MEGCKLSTVHITTFDYRALSSLQMFTLFKNMKEKINVYGGDGVSGEDTLKPTGHLTFTQHLLHKLKIRSSNQGFI